MSESKTMESSVAPPAKSVETVPKSGATAVATSPKRPTYATMIVKALTALAERKGSSRQAIVKYIVGTYNMSETSRVEKLVSGALKAQMEAGSVINATGTGLSGRFKLSPAMKTQLVKVEKERAKKAGPKKENGKRKKSVPASSAAVKPKKSVKKQTEKSSKPKPALKSPKKKSEGKPKATSGSKMMKPQGKNGKKTSKSADALKAPKPKKSPKAVAPKVEKAQTVAE